MSWVWKNVGGKIFPIQDRLFEKLQNLKKIQKRRFDSVFLVVGDETTGKSTIALTCLWWLSNGKLTTANIAPDAASAIEKLENAPDESVLLIDEGSLMFSSKDTMKKEQRRLLKILNVCGQKKMILCIALPDFFDLNRYIAISRSRFLIKTYVRKKDLKRGQFMYWGTDSKKKLYEFGKRHYGSYKWPRSDWRGTFKNFNPLGQAYLDLKKKSLMSALKHEETDTYDNKSMLQRDVLLNHILKNKIMNRNQIVTLLSEYNCSMDKSNLTYITRKLQKTLKLKAE